MQREREVQWDLVDYGAGKFHVVSYQARAAELEAPEAGGAAEAPSEPARLSDCLFYRCWSALRDGCGRAA